MMGVGVGGSITRGRKNVEKIELEAVYENGRLKLPRELPLRQGQRVTVTILPLDTAGQRLHGLLQWKGSQEDLDYLLGRDNTTWAGEEK
jgi:predicted DNA-binding antitoxin AbrB/MazE fold protein